jgi:hypothetical protein
MERLTVAELALKVRMSPSRMLEKARPGEIPWSNWEGDLRPQAGLIWKQC